MIVHVVDIDAWLRRSDVRANGLTLCGESAVWRGQWELTKPRPMEDIVYPSDAGQDPALVTCRRCAAALALEALAATGER